MDIVVHHGSVFEVTADALALPQNAAGDLSGGVVGAAARALGPLPTLDAAGLRLGDAHWVDLGDGARGLLLLIVREARGSEVLPDAIGRAVTAALDVAQRRRLGSLAFVGVGAGASGLPAPEVAKAMVAALRAHAGELPELCVLADANDAVVRAWEEALGRR